MSVGLSTSFPANSNACYVQKDKNTTLVANHRNGLYHARVTPNDQKEAAHATIDVNLLHQQMEHISVGRIKQMVKCGQLRGIDTLSGTLMFCEACTLGKMKKAPFELQDGPRTTLSSFLDKINQTLRCVYQTTNLISMNTRP